jgi:hypothetical protein
VAADGPADVLDVGGAQLVVEDRFDGAELDRRLWLPYYLPHWSSRAATAARYDLVGGALRLRIDADQPPWSPEFDGGIRVSSLQTGELAGPRGTSVGQHRFREGLVVREEQPPVALLAPTFGVFEIRARATPDPDAMVAFWMIGSEDVPEQSAEICIAEIFGREVDRHRALVGVGLHPFGDPEIDDDFTKVAVDIDVTEAHDYAADWTPSWVGFYVDGRLVKTARQSPAYRMQIMLGIYDLASGPEPASAPDRYPKTFLVERFRAWRR